MTEGLTKQQTNLEERPRAESPSTSTASSALTTTKPQQGAEVEYPPFLKVLAVLIGIFICAFLVSLDRTIVATAIPRITNEFNSLGDVGWYASSYLLTLCGFQLLFGRIFTFFNVKIVYLASIFIFEVGSAICGSAPNSPVFIFGRAIAGIGAAGIFNGAIPIYLYLLPLHKRPIWISVFGMVFGIGSIVAPLIGGAFTDKVSWRWCFYINLPLGAATFVIILFTLKQPPHKAAQETSWKTKLIQLDPLGVIVFFPCIACLLLAIQWGGVTYSWSNARIIALLVLFGVLLIIFIAIQLWRKDLATVPPHILKGRSMIGGLLFMFCLGSSQFVMIYFLPIWFQAIKGVSALESGVRVIPMMLPLVIATISAGIMVQKTGYYTPFMYLAAIISPIGAGLISTFTVTTGHSKWIGYQVIYGLGIGSGINQPMIVAQNVLAQKDVPTGVALCFFMQSLSGAMFTSIADTVFGNHLSQGLASIPDVDVGMVAHEGATELRNHVSVASLPAVLRVYNGAIRQAFYVATIMAALFVLGAALVEWRSIKKVKPGAFVPETKVGDAETVK